MKKPVYPAPKKFLCLLFCAAVLAGCARLRPAAEVPTQQAPAELIQGLRERAEFWRIYSAMAVIRIESPQGVYRMHGTLVAQPPDRFRLEATSLSGQVLWLLILAPQGATLWVPADKVIYQAARGETLLEHFLGVPIAPEIFVYSFAGCIPPNQLTSDFRISSRPTDLLGYSRDQERSWRFTWDFVPYPLALRSLKASRGQMERQYDIRFNPAVPLEPRSAPDRVVLSSGDWLLEATMKQMLHPDVVPASAFSLPALAGMRLVNLDARKEGG
jgi:hypothetical protein